MRVKVPIRDPLLSIHHSLFPLCALRALCGESHAPYFLRNTFYFLSPQTPLLTTIFTTLNIEHMNYSELYQRLRSRRTRHLLRRGGRGTGIRARTALRRLHARETARPGSNSPTYLEPLLPDAAPSAPPPRSAGVTVYKAQGWQYENELGFVRRRRGGLPHIQRQAEGDRHCCARATRKPLQRC